MTGIGKGTKSGKELRGLIEEIEGVRDRKKQLSEQEKEIFQRGKALSFEVKTIRTILTLRKQDVSARQQQEALLDTYMHAIGMAEEPPLFMALGKFAVDLAAREEAVEFLKSIVPPQWRDRTEARRPAGARLSRLGRCRLGGRDRRPGADDQTDETRGLRRHRAIPDRGPRRHRAIPDRGPRRHPKITRQECCRPCRASCCGEAREGIERNGGRTMTDAIAEFSVRLFYTAADCDLAPSVAICFPVANVGDVNWPSVLTELIEKAQGTVEGAPVENIRPMTQDETARYRAAERGE